MKKLLLFFLLINISLISYIPFVSAENIKVSYFTFMIPDSPMTIENGPKGMSWSISGSPGPMPRMEMKLEGKNGDVALFGNNSTTFASTWNGSTSIIPKTIGKFTLKIYVYSSNGLITATRNIEMEVKSNTQYSVSGQSSIYVGDKGTFRLNTTQYVKSTKWTLSNTNATMESQQTGSVVLVPTKAGNVIVNAEITLVSGEVRKASWYVALNENPFKNVRLTGDDEIIYYGQDISYKLEGVVSGTKIEWRIDDYDARITNGQGTNQIKLRLGSSSSNFKLTANLEYMGKNLTVSKEIIVKHVKGKTPGLITSSDPFTVEIENYDLLKRIYPDAKFEWERLVVSPEGMQSEDFLTEINKDYKTGKTTYTCHRTGIAELSLSIIINGEKVDYINSFFINFREEPFFHTIYMSTVNSLYVCNIPNDVDVNKTEVFKVNEKYDTYDIRYTFPYRIGNLNAYLIIIEETAKSDRARIKVRMHYNDGTYKDIISPIITFESAIKSATTSAFSTQQMELNPQTINDYNKVYSVEIYTIPLGNKVYSKKGIINFDVNDLLIPKGMYVIKKTDNEGNITSEKIYKTR
ncbi:MAG: hypothetical protein LBT43_07755 [Prevotella sp.]|jgi:hypothetical protein|nr:hypothetical protein [Prevotella sp.]